MTPNPNNCTIKAIEDVHVGSQSYLTWIPASSLKLTRGPQQEAGPSAVYPTKYMLKNESIKNPASPSHFSESKKNQSHFNRIPDEMIYPPGN